MQAVGQTLRATSLSLQQLKSSKQEIVPSSIKSVSRSQLTCSLVEKRLFLVMFKIKRLNLRLSLFKNLNFTPFSKFQVKNPAGKSRAPGSYVDWRATYQVRRE